MKALDILAKLLALLPALSRLLVAIQAAVDEEGPGGRKVTAGETAELVAVAVKSFGEAAISLFKRSS